MNITKQLEALHAKRKALVAGLEQLVKASEEESRLFNADEQKQFDQNQAEVGSVDAQIKRLEDMKRILGDDAEPVDPNASTPGVKGAPAAASAGIVQFKPREKGAVFTRYAMALLQSQGNLFVAQEVAKKWRDTTPEVESTLR